MDELMIFRKLNGIEVQILKLLKRELFLSHSKLSRYMQKAEDELTDSMLHLEREGLITAKRDSVRREHVYCPTMRGLCLTR